MRKGHVRKADQVAEQLLQKIVWQQYQPGDILPKESELAETFGVNRSVVREAIKSLEVHRLVQPIKRRGTVVLNPMTSLSPAVLRALLVDQDGMINIAILENLLQIRKSLDITMAELAAKHRTAAQLTEMRDRLRAVKAAFENESVYEAELCALVLLIARSTDNRIFEMLVHWHENVSYDLGHLMGSARKPSLPHVQGLETLINLIEAGESETAGQLVRAFHGFATPLLLDEARRRNRDMQLIGTSH